MQRRRCASNTASLLFLVYVEKPTRMSASHKSVLSGSHRTYAIFPEVVVSSCQRFAKEMMLLSSSSLTEVYPWKKLASNDFETLPSCVTRVVDEKKNHGCPRCRCCGSEYCRRMCSHPRVFPAHVAVARRRTAVAVDHALALHARGRPVDQRRHGGRHHNEKGLMEGCGREHLGRGKRGRLNWQLAEC